MQFLIEAFRLEAVRLEVCKLGKDFNNFKSFQLKIFIVEIRNLELLLRSVMSMQIGPN